MEFPRVQDFILTIQQAVSEKPRLVRRADSLCNVIHNAYPNVKIVSSNGATKECLVFPELGYVLKWSMETRDAEREVAVYQKAVEANLADFFPATMLATLSPPVMVKRLRSPLNRLSPTVPTKSAGQRADCKGVSSVSQRLFLIVALIRLNDSSARQTKMAMDATSMDCGQKSPFPSTASARLSPSVSSSRSIT